MAGAKANKSGSLPPNASQTRHDDTNEGGDGPPRPRIGAAKAKDYEGKLLTGMADLQKKGAEELQAMGKDTRERGTVQHLLKALHDLEELATKLVRAYQHERKNETAVTPTRGDEIIRRLQAIEERLAKPAQERVPAAPGARTWSQVAAKTSGQPARVELRLETMEGADRETPQEQLERVRKVIPEAQAIITHARSHNKISVVVKDAARRDQILLGGIQGVEGMKIIRRPRLVMVSGIPLDAPIKNGKCAENDEWIAHVHTKNKGMRVERARWLYSDKNLATRRAEGKQKKGSVILSMTTEEGQHKAVQKGLFVGAEWHPVQLWDVSLTDGQCFKCWKWGHNQSVCNSLREMCGHCAGTHATRDCTTKEDKDASCACCKQKGHRAWMSKSCRAYQRFRDENEKKKKELVGQTLAIQMGEHDAPGHTSPVFSFGGATRVNSPTFSHSESEWQVVGGPNKRQRTEVARVGRPSFLQKAGSAPGQLRFPILQRDSNSDSTTLQDTIPSTQ